MRKFDHSYAEVLYDLAKNLPFSEQMYLFSDVLKAINTAIGQEEELVELNEEQRNLFTAHILGFREAVGALYEDLSGSIREYEDFEDVPDEDALYYISIPTVAALNNKPLSYFNRRSLEFESDEMDVEIVNIDDERTYREDVWRGLYPELKYRR